jgi:hypothetical protein
MPQAQYTSDEVVDRGEEIYEREIRAKVEPDHIGEFLVLDIVSGRYVVDADEMAALRRARAEHPEGVRYLKRVGFRAAHRIGARLSKPR